jgi:hypothetical protein
LTVFLGVGLRACVPASSAVTWLPMCIVRDYNRSKSSGSKKEKPPEFL